MDDATYHALARHEHEVKARVYAKHGLFRRADSHLDRADYHASFGAKSTPKRPKEPKVREKPKKVKLGLGAEKQSAWSRPSLDRIARSPDTSDTELDEIPRWLSGSYRPEVSRKHSAHAGWSRPSLGRIVDDDWPDAVSKAGYAPRKSLDYSRRFMGSSDPSEW